MSDIGHATLNVVPSTKGFGKALNSELGPIGQNGGTSLGGKIGGGLSKAIGPLMAAAGVIGMGAFIGASIKSAGALEQSIGAINSVFKGSAIEMHGWAVDAATSVGLARNEYNELGTLIGSQLKNAGTAMEELGPKTNELITLGADLSSMFGGTTKEAVEAVSSALKGERDPIEKYGVSLKQASIDAKAAELGFTKVGGALSAEANAAATVALIMEQTADAHGNFAKESVTYEGVMQRLKASWDNVSATLGGAFLPFAMAAGSILLEMMPTIQAVAEAFNSFGERMGAVFSEAGGGFEGFGAMVQAAFGELAGFISGGGLTSMLEGFSSSRESFFNAIMQGLPGLLEAFVAFIPQLVTFVTGTLLPQLVTEFTTLVTTLVTTLATILPQLVTAFAAAAPLLLAGAASAFMQIVQALVTVLPQLLITLAGMLPSILTTLVGMIPMILETAITLFQSLVEAVVTVLPELLMVLIGEVLPNLLTTVLDMLPSLLASGIELFFSLVTAILEILPQLITTLIGDVLPTLVTTLVGMVPKLFETAIKLFETLVDGVTENLPEILDVLVNDVIPSIVDALIDAVPKLLDAGVDLIAGLVEGLWSAAGSVGEALLGIIGGAVEGFKDFLGIASPSKLMRQLGLWTGEGFTIGLDDTVEDVSRSAMDIAQAATGVLGNVRVTPGVGPIDYDAHGGYGGNAPGSGATYSTTYNDFSTSQEDKEAKLQRAHTTLQAVVAATTGR